MARVQFALLLVALASPAAKGSFEAKCATVLTGIATSGNNDAEVSAFCRRAYTPQMCKTMRSDLGAMPWQQDRIQTACQTWGSRMLPGSGASVRELMSYQDFQSTLDQSAKTKSDLGMDMPRHPDGSVDLDKTIEMKHAQSKVVTDAYDAYYNPKEAHACCNSQTAVCLACKQGTSVEEYCKQNTQVQGCWDTQRKWSAIESSEVAGSSQSGTVLGCALVFGLLLAIISVPVGFIRGRQRREVSSQAFLRSETCDSDAEREGLLTIAEESDGASSGL